MTKKNEQNAHKPLIIMSEIFSWAQPLIGWCVCVCVGFSSLLHPGSELLLDPLVRPVVELLLPDVYRHPREDPHEGEAALESPELALLQPGHAGATAINIHCCTPMYRMHYVYIFGPQRKTRRHSSTVRNWKRNRLGGGGKKEGKLCAVLFPSLSLAFGRRKFSPSPIFPAISRPVSGGSQFGAPKGL